MTHIWLRKAKVKKRAMTHNSRIGQNLKNPDPLQVRLFNKTTICEKKNFKKFILVPLIRVHRLLILNFHIKNPTSICVGGDAIFELWPIAYGPNLKCFIRFYCRKKYPDYFTNSRI